MLNRRITIAALAGGLGLLAAALAWGVFGPVFSSADWFGASSQTSSTEQVSPLARSWSPLSINRHSVLDLRLAPMTRLDTTDIARERARRAKAKAKAARAAKNKAQHSPKLKSPASVPPIQRPLDLSLPSVTAPIIAGTPQSNPTSSTPSRDARARKPQDQAKLNLRGPVNPPDFDSEQAHKLFNRDNGLRGFMKQSWVNQNLGFQGGLAIKPKRLRENDSDLRDNMAVGMGVLLAF